MYKTIFGKIADYIQSMHKRKAENGNGVVCKEQKGCIKILMADANTEQKSFFK
jgi:hypothetical protein